MNIRIKFFPYQPHCFAYGGFENLMNSTYESLRSMDVSISKIDVWSKEDDFDIAHIWGLGSLNFANIIWAKRKNKKVVVTTIFPDYLTFKQIFRYYMSTALGRRKDFSEVIPLVDFLIVTTERSRIVAVKYYNFPVEKVCVIPNTLLSSYYKKYDDMQLDSFKLQNYVFTIGNVCKRKNQLRLALACLKVKVNLLIVGPIIPGEEEYGEELERLINTSDSIVWLKGMKRDSLELISAYKKSILFALPSFDEQQPTSAQEAGLLGKPLLLGNLPYARQKFYKNACLVNPGNVDSIASGIEAIIKNPFSFIPPIDVFEECKESNVAEKHLQIFRKL